MILFLGTRMSSSAFVTVVTGVSVFVLGRLIIKGVESYISFKEQLGEISHLLLSNQAKLSNPRSDLKQEIIHDLKDAAAQLRVKYELLPFYIKMLHIGFRLVPSETEIRKAAQELNLIASIHDGKTGELPYEHIAKIGLLLRIPTTYSA
ncbi:hypothetical protein BX69_14110 [Escherichia coli O111:NM str. 2010C-4592]|nr:hypothetical protein BX59_20335 [Escherichia coli O111:NM str. 2010C-4086]EYX78395.1 hypothetical protein BY05_10370 [Escherichia coli O111:NM str. 2011C-3632]EYZ05304.1 hypothetical protein BX69_14110 [Escherichia coli O111:NM str. 2010C-4592]EZD64298.1 hypothetical protein BZ04_26220 [Escherichia coli O111:NM str. K6908]EZQ22394.1 hypothetical protein BX37_24630 [Escherichia coli O111:H8 str. 2009EL-2169]